MSFATLSAENRLNVGLRELDCSESAFSKIADLPGTSVSHALRGHTPFTNERGAHAMKVLSELRELAASTGGVPINFSNPSVIRNLLEERRRLKREATAPPEVVSVSVGGYLLVDRSSFGQLITTTFAAMAAKMSRQTAERVAEELRKLGQKAVEIHANLSGGNNSTFESIMGLPEVESVIVGEAEPQ
jgi:hypothetical protein